MKIFVNAIFALEKRHLFRHLTSKNDEDPHWVRVLADWTGLEPATSAVTGRHSNQLNYQSKVQYLYKRAVIICSIVPFFSVRAAKINAFWGILQIYFAICLNFFVTKATHISTRYP